MTCEEIEPIILMTSKKVSKAKMPHSFAGRCFVEASRQRKQHDLFKPLYLQHYGRKGVVIDRDIGENQVTVVNLNQITYASMIDVEHAVLNYSGKDWFIEVISERNGVSGQGLRNSADENVTAGVAVSLGLGILTYGIGMLVVSGSAAAGLGLTVFVSGTRYVGTQAVSNVLGGRTQAELDALTHVRF